jgi:GntR family transcriptional regulator, trigonelline degradation regulator
MLWRIDASRKFKFQNSTNTRTRHRLERARCCAGRRRFGKRTFDDAQWHRKQAADEAMMDDLDALRGKLSVVRETTTLRVLALEQLRRAIVDGKLAPGARLVERRLCDLLGVSRTVVREILRQLEAEGWVVNPPYKGPSVATIGKDEARQIYGMRIALEGYAASMCATHATEAQIDRLEQAVHAMAAAARKKDMERHIRAIEQFYEVLLDAAGNTMMSLYLQSLRSRVARLRSFSLAQPQRAAVSIAEKTRLVAAIRARDADLARRLSEEHVHAAAETIFATTFASEVSDAPQGVAAPAAGRRSVAPQKSRAPRATPPKQTATLRAVRIRSRGT